MVRGLAFFKECLTPKVILSPAQNFAALISHTEKSLSPDIRVKR